MKNFRKTKFRQSFLHSASSNHKVVFYSPHRFEWLPGFITVVNFGSCEALLPPNSFNGDWIMERNFCLSESMRNDPFTKFKLSLLISSTAFLNKLCFNSPHRDALLPSCAWLVFYTILQIEKADSLVNAVLIHGYSPTATQTYLTDIQVNIQWHIWQDA